jgi:predicted methyltransferase
MSDENEKMNGDASPFDKYMWMLQEQTDTARGRAFELVVMGSDAPGIVAVDAVLHHIISAQVLLYARDLYEELVVVLREEQELSALYHYMNGRGD